MSRPPTSTACPLTDDGSSHTTMIDLKMMDAVSPITGGRRYSFHTEGDTNLFVRCAARRGRHDFVSGSLAVGPNVWLDSESTAAYSDIGPHHRYAVGQLYDSIVGAMFRAWNRHWYVARGLLPPTPFLPQPLPPPPPLKHGVGSRLEWGECGFLELQSG